MLIKEHKDRRGAVSELEATLPHVPEWQRQQIEEEVRAIRAGAKAEREAAYLIDFHFKNSRNTAVLHDLRLEVNGRSVQIDHVLIHRSLNVFVLETKSCHSGLKITDQGEFLRWNKWKNTFEGMESPLAQNERHIAVLKEAFGQIDMPVRLGIRLMPTFHSVVVINSRARIDRPSPQKFDSSRVVKADMLKGHVEKILEEQTVFGILAKRVDADTLEHIARSLASLHRPIEPNFRSRFANRREGIGETVPSVPATVADFSCRACDSSNLFVQHGKYGYYFKCLNCGGNTPIRVTCLEGHRERIHKRGAHFFRECPECGTRAFFWFLDAASGIQEAA